MISKEEKIPKEVEEGRKTEDLLIGFKESVYPEEYGSKDTQLKKRRFKFGIICSIGLLIQKTEFAVLSSINYLAIYYIVYLSLKDESIKLENSITLSSILTFAQFSTNWIGGVLDKYIHIRFIMIIGGAFFILSSIGILSFETLLGYKFMMFLFGTGIGIQEGVVYANASAFIPEKKGLINGIANVGWTLACSFFNYIGLLIVNPNEIDVHLGEDNGISDNIIKYTIITIILFGVFSTISTILTIRYKKEDYLILDDNLDEEEKIERKEEIESQEDNKNNEIIEVKGDIIVKEEKKKSFLAFLRCMRFYTCFLMCSFKNIHCNLVTSSFTLFSFHYKTVSADTQRYIASASFIVNLVITAVLSLFIDKFKYRTIVIPSNILCLIHAITFQYIIKNQILYIIYFFLSGLFSSIENLATYPHILKVFGIEYGAIIIGIFCFGTGLGNFGVNTFVDYILSSYNDNQTQEYDKAVALIFYMNSCFIFIAILFMALETEKSVLS